MPLTVLQLSLSLPVPLTVHKPLPVPLGGYSVSFMSLSCHAAPRLFSGASKTAPPGGGASNLLASV